MGAVCGTPNAASADAEVNVADAARPALRPIPRSETGDKTVVAETDRARVLATWAEACGGVTPGEVVVPFADVRRMPPEAFVAFLKDTLGVSGIVAGSDYRFGFKAAGTAEALRTIGEAMGLDVTVVDLLPSGEDPPGADEHLAAACELDEKDATAQVSSTRVRACLAAGDVEQAARLLGRPHRLVLDVASADAVSTTQSRGSETATFPLCAAQNQYPACGTYEGVLPNDGDGVATNKRSVRVTVEVTETDVAVTAPRAADLAAFAGGVDLVSRARR